MDILYSILAGIGAIVILMMVFMFVWGLFLARQAKKDKRQEKQVLWDHLNPEKQKERLDILVEEAKEQVAILESHQKDALEQAEKILEKGEDDGSPKV
tara:strand:+ start:1279 stop:1572 length:294 start_codon:yes stop_codon:yes gene_type:complete